MAKPREKPDGFTEKAQFNEILGHFAVLCGAKDDHPMNDHFAPLPAPNPEPAPAVSVLVVDDSKTQRRLLTLLLQRWGYQIAEAGSGEEALALCRDQSFDIIISDWMMPGLSGPEFCAAFRAMAQENYGYFILLTSKSEKAEVADGLESGADEYLIKPFAPDELRARLRAGERIVTMQKEVMTKNRLLAKALADVNKAQETLRRDLVEARRLQQALVGERFVEWERGSLTLFLRPSGHVGGDLPGYFECDGGRIGAYSLDVSGHGVASAMMTARLAGLLSNAAPAHNLALRIGSKGERTPYPAAEVAARLNRTMMEDLHLDQYFTMAYAEIDLAQGTVALVQAGHPHPFVLRQNGSVEHLGAGGLPIGLLPDVSHEITDLQLGAGDRLFLLSDGFTECQNPLGEELGQDGLTRMIVQNRHLPSRALVDALMWDLASFAQSEDFGDDISGLVFDYRG